MHTKELVMNLLIESFEGGIYLAYRIENQKKHLIRDEKQHPLKFLSLEQVRHHFRDDSFSSATLIHNNAYDEMCGEDDGNSPPLEIDLCWH
ncbi:DUF6482 family protein [Vibrio sinaloensis]|uniref:DUF6482 family protein n=1 Tax=Photobacterium sp. (strain ATCC 43367) TaxID=379097 RepID=UPI00244844E7|nr:DUF6482 family protein [Vibrio sinaloensis]